MDDVQHLRLLAENQLGVPATLHNYQWDGVAFLYRSHSALLADEMGLGKTVQAAVALALLLNGNSDVNRALIVAPASLTTNWVLELSTWAPSLTVWRVRGTARSRTAFYLLPVPVLVASYEQIRSDGIDRIPTNTFDLVILDEAQRIKNRNSATSLACRLLPHKRAWALSATPLENDKEDLLSILGFLERSTLRELPKAHLTEKLNSMMLRRRKSSVRAELPPVIFQDLKLELSGPQRDEYDKLWVDRTTDVRANLGTGDIGTVLLGLITRLKIVCNYVSPTNTSAKLDALRTICEGVGNSARILVFSQFVATLRWLSERIGLPYTLLTGSMSLDERQESIDIFKVGPTPRVLLVSLRAGGVGLNLGEATHVVLFDRWWNPAVEVQAIFRAHRFDREEPLHVVRFLVADSIEERIAKILERKECLFDEIIESAETASHRFTKEELMEILQLRAGDVFSSTKKREENTNGTNRRTSGYSAG